MNCFVRKIGQFGKRGLAVRAAAFGVASIRDQRSAIDAATMASLPAIHGDPFDRILIAQAMSEPLHLVTTDERLAEYSELVVLV